MSIRDYTVEIWFSQNDNCYVAKVMEFDYCMAHGDTPQEAEQEMKIAARMWLDTARKYGDEIPKPRKYCNLSEAVA